MAVVPREAIDQFGALMEEGQLILILISFFYCFLISHFMATITYFCGLSFSCGNCCSR